MPVPVVVSSNSYSSSSLTGAVVPSFVGSAKFASVLTVPSAFTVPAAVVVVAVAGLTFGGALLNTTLTLISREDEI